FHQSGDRWSSNSQHSVGLECDQLSRERSHAIDFAIRPTIRDPNVATRPAERLESLPESGDLRLCLRVGLARSHQHADGTNPLGLLRPRRERPRHHAAEQRDELAPWSFDHLVSAQQYRRWNFDADRFGSLKIHGKLEYGWLFDRQVGRLGTPQNFI